MNAFNAWLLSSTLAFTAAVLGYLNSESGFAWTALAYPLPLLRDNFEAIYLADFAYISFLAMSCYWFLVVLVGKKMPVIMNMSAVFLALAGAAFAIVAIDFLIGILPHEQTCSGRNMGNGLMVETCVYSSSYRVWTAWIAAACLTTSLVASILGAGRERNEKNGRYE